VLGKCFQGRPLKGSLFSRRVGKCVSVVQALHAPRMQFATALKFTKSTPRTRFVPAHKKNKILVLPFRLVGISFLETGFLKYIFSKIRLTDV